MIGIKTKTLQLCKQTLQEMPQCKEHGSTMDFIFTLQIIIITTSSSSIGRLPQ